MQDRYGVNERCGCAASRFERRVRRYRSVRPDQASLRQRIKEITEERVRCNYRRIHVLLMREGWPVNVKCVRRLYRIERVGLRAKSPRRYVTEARRVEHPLASRLNKVWAMDFLSDAPFNGKRCRTLTVVEAYPRERLALYVDKGIKGEQVVDAMDRPIFQRSTPSSKLRIDNGLDLTFARTRSLGVHRLGHI